jgi:hypothetical protein
MATLSQEELEALKKRRREEERLAEQFDQDPGGGDNICLSCE